MMFGFGPKDSRSPAVIKQAGSWFVKMRGPDRDALRAQFERWREAHPAHREAYALAEQQWAGTEAIAGTEMGRNRRLPERRSAIWELPAARPAFAAIALVLAAGAGFWLFGVPGDLPDGTLVAVVEPQSTGIGEIRTVKLADGTTVILDTDSAIEVRLASDLRQVRLVRGRARFEVAHDASRPFQVVAGGRTVTALATLFDVGFEPGGVSVSLLRGVVDVRGVAAVGGAASVTRLKPGECFTDRARGSHVVKASPGSLQWVSGMLDFDGVPLGSVLDQTNRYSPRKILLGDPALATRRVTGAFRPLPVDELAAALAAAFSLRVERASQGDLILHRQ